MTNRELRPSMTPPAPHAATGRTRGPGSRLLLVTLAALAMLVGACSQTDRDLYAPGEVGEVTFRNPLRYMPLWLGGCTAFVQERFADGGWVDEGGEVVCIWEGFATPVAAEDERFETFTARDPGTWRLSYDVGFGCQADRPLREDHCRRLTTVASNEFVVAEADDHQAFCRATGGEWNIAFCGHLYCGRPNACLALVPGCDCGPSANFVDGIGCVEDSACDNLGGDAQALCEDTGGIWDPFSCGHYSCGNLPECDAVIPGCNCGPFSVFTEELGCLAVPCGAPQ